MFAVIKGNLCLSIYFERLSNLFSELKEAKEKKKAQAALLKQEQHLATAVASWNNEFIPKWNTV